MARIKVISLLPGNLIKIKKYMLKANATNLLLANSLTLFNKMENLDNFIYNFINFEYVESNLLQ